MAEKEKQSKPGRIGCALVVLGVLAAIVGGGAWLGHKEDESRTPCERYARAVSRALNNCHSGHNDTHAHHVAICEKSVNPTSECIDAIESLSKTSCESFERGHLSVLDVCRKQP